MKVDNHGNDLNETKLVHLLHHFSGIYLIQEKSHGPKNPEEDGLLFSLKAQEFKLL